MVLPPSTGCEPMFPLSPSNSCFRRRICRLLGMDGPILKSWPSPAFAGPSHHCKTSFNQPNMSTQTIYIPNLTGGQAIQLTKASGVYSISADSFASRGLTLEDLDDRMDALEQTRPSSPASMTSDSSSSSTEYIPDDAF